MKTKNPKSGVRNEVPLSLSAPKTFSVLNTPPLPIPPPSRRVRAICATLLTAPVVLGILLLIALPPRDSVQVRSTLFKFVQLKIFSPEAPLSESTINNANLQLQ